MQQQMQGNLPPGGISTDTIYTAALQEIFVLEPERPSRLPECVGNSHTLSQTL